jgi:hypothetical protein
MDPGKTVLCDNCRKSVATIHLTGWESTGVGTTEERVVSVNQHFCEACARELKQTNAFLNPGLKTRPGARAVKLRVVSVSADRVQVEVINKTSDSSKDQWCFLRSRIPSHYAVDGMEFAIFATDAELKGLEGDN